MPFCRLRTPLFLAFAICACSESPPLDPQPPGEAFASVAAGGHTTCALTVSGRAFCWGRGTDGQLGNGGAATEPSPVPVAADLRFSALSVGYYHTCGLTEDGAAYCWGARQERHGQLGNASAERGSRRPVAVATQLRFIQLAAGQVHTCGLTTKGAAYCWGSNHWGQLGDGTTVDRQSPVAVGGGERFVGLGAGALHTCGVAADGRVLCWGDNFFGSVTGNPQAHTPDTCGDGRDARCTLLPHALPTAERFASVTSGDAVTCGISRAGDLWCWGGSARDPAVPRKIQAGPGIAAAAAGSGHACALAPDAAAFCHGGNHLGQLGTGDAAVEYSPVPLPVAGGHEFRSLAAGTFHACGVSAEGVAYCWGGNRDGQLGSGAPQTCQTSYPCSRTPQRVRNQ